MIWCRFWRWETRLLGSPWLQSQDTILILTPGLNQYFSKLNLPPSHVRITWAPRLTHRIRIAWVWGPGDLWYNMPLKWPEALKVPGLQWPLPFPSSPVCAWGSRDKPRTSISLFCEAEAGGGSITSQRRGQPVTPVTLTSLAADECISDRNRREIPVAVGLSIVVLLAVLLTACLVTRKRPSRGYERM